MHTNDKYQKPYVLFMPRYVYDVMNKSEIDFKTLEQITKGKSFLEYYNDDNMIKTTMNKILNIMSKQDIIDMININILGEHLIHTNEKELYELNLDSKINNTNPLLVDIIKYKFISNNGISTNDIGTSRGLKEILNLLYEDSNEKPYSIDVCDNGLVVICEFGFGKHYHTLVLTLVKDLLNTFKINFGEKSAINTGLHKIL